MRLIHFHTILNRRSLALMMGLGILAIPMIAAAQVVTQAYGITGTVQKGMVVMLDPKNKNNIEALSNTNETAMQGVVVAAGDAPISLSGDTTVDQAYVATTGKYDVLVSTQNGAIKTGDLISISALDGIGMKADASESVILGKALGSFDSTSAASGTSTLTNSAGVTSTVSIGLVQVDIGISHNPLSITTPGAGGGGSGAVPGFLRSFADNIAGKSVTTTRIYVSFAVLLVTVIIVSSLLFSGVRSSLTSIGRNPLARQLILRGLVQVTIVGVVIFIVGIIAVLLILKV